MITVYDYLLAARDIDELIEDVFECKKEDVDSYFIDVIYDAINNQATYASYVNDVLKNWKFDRLGLIEQAILLNGCAEFHQKKISAAVIIDESVELAKKYCDNDAYKLVNRVLDII